jgi:ubiquinone/menaquinone biosynthesis C-methylase UbiE
VFLEAARKRSNDPRFGFQHPDARALPFADGSFDRAFSMLVPSFIPDIEHAVAEMRRVVRPGREGDCSSTGPVRRNAGLSVVAGHCSRARSNAERSRALFSSLTAPGEMSAMWH